MKRILNDLWEHFKRMEGFVRISVEALLYLIACPYIYYTGSCGLPIKAVLSASLSGKQCMESKCYSNRCDIDWLTQLFSFSPETAVMSQSSIMDGVRLEIQFMGPGWRWDPNLGTVMAVIWYFGEGVKVRCAPRDVDVGEMRCNTRCYTGPYMGNGVILTYIADWPNSGKQAAWLRQCIGKYTHFTKLPLWQKRWYVLEHMCQYTSTHALQNMWQTYAETARMSVKQALFVIDYQIPAVWQLPWWGHQTRITS